MKSEKTPLQEKEKEKEKQSTIVFEVTNILIIPSNENIQVMIDLTKWRLGEYLSLERERERKKENKQSRQSRTQQRHIKGNNERGKHRKVQQRSTTTLESHTDLFLHNLHRVQLSLYCWSQY